MRKKSERKPSKPRNWMAVHAHLRRGAGSHGDGKKAAIGRACRGKVVVE